MNENDTSREVLQRLLIARQPDLGARLKQRMIAEYTREGLGRFDEKALGFKKFKDYLLAVHADMVQINQSSSQGDFEVSLRDSVAQEPPSFGNRIRSAVWTAFSNPDPKRERYFHKSTGAVLHFLSDAPEKAQHDLGGGDYVQIDPLSPTLQKTWMLQFLDALEPGAAREQQHAAIRDREYTSALNSEFTKLLGGEAHGWREFRTDLVVKSILKWADEHGIAHEVLFNPPPPAVDKSPHRKPGLTAKAKAIHLLDALDEDTINQSVIPLLVSAILLSRK